MGSKSKFRALFRNLLENQRHRHAILLFRELGLVLIDPVNRNLVECRDIPHRIVVPIPPRGHGRGPVEQNAWFGVQFVSLGNGEGTGSAARSSQLRQGRAAGPFHSPGRPGPVPNPEPAEHRSSGRSDRSCLCAAERGVSFVPPLGDTAFCPGLQFRDAARLRFGHEAAPGKLHPSPSINEGLGICLYSLFPGSYHLFAIAHLVHHQRNRSDAELEDYILPAEMPWLKRVTYYLLLCGLFWVLTPPTVLGLALWRPPEPLEKAWPPFFQASRSAASAASAA